MTLLISPGIYLCCCHGQLLIVVLINGMDIRSNESNERVTATVSMWSLHGSSCRVSWNVKESRLGSQAGFVDAVYPVE